MSAYRRPAGVLTEPLGTAWAAFSPLSGDTILLNDECAAILEILEAGPMTSAAVIDLLCADTGLEAGRIGPLVEDAWHRMLEGGLVRIDAPQQPSK